jgi:hypothetical protein
MAIPTSVRLGPELERKVEDYLRRNTPCSGELEWSVAAPPPFPEFRERSGNSRGYFQTNWC